MTYTYEQYKELRSKGYKPSYLAVHNPLDNSIKDIDWDESGGLPSAIFEKDGFEINIKLKHDDYPDTSCIGNYTNNPDNGAIKRVNAGRNEFEYFLPTISYAEHHKGLREFNYGKHEADCLARLYNKQDFETMESLNNGDLSHIGIIVTASKQNVILGENSIWGIMLENFPDIYINECAWDCISEAIAEAKIKLNDLQKKE